MGLLRYKKAILGVLLLFFLLFSLFFRSVYSLWYRPLLSPQTDSQIITLDKATSAYQFAYTLKKQNIIQSPRLFLAMMQLQGLTHKLKAGVYSMQKGETAIDLLQKVVAGNVLTQNFVIVEGTTQDKVSKELQQAPFLEYHPEDWAAVSEGHPSAEGMLLADTYQYPGGASSKILLDKAHRSLMLYVQDSWAHRDAGLPYKNAYEMLIAASIIEKETAIAQERKLISGVVVNRLKKYMPLQMDPTVIYGLGTAYTGKLRHSDLLIPSPYNSYQNRGLPPTPIAMVGKEAIDAAAHPQRSNYLYYVARGDGTHQFSERYEQQRRAIYELYRKDS